MRRTVFFARPGLAPLALIGVGLLVVLVRLWLATRVVTPWVLIDELLHSSLAQSVRDEGSFTVRGQRITVTFVYPLLIAPAWLAHSMTTTYVLAKTINVVVMSSVAIPVYAWGRTMLSPSRAAAAAVLCLLAPSLALTGTLMQENAFLPLFVLACLAIARTIERPSGVRQILALLAIAVACATRAEGFLLIMVAATAIAIEARFARVRMRDAFLRFSPSALFLGVALAVFLAIRGVPGSLGVYSHTTRADYGAHDILRWAGYSFGVLALSVGIVPLVAFLILVASRPWDAQYSSSERAFLAVCSSVVAWLVALGAVSAAWDPVGMKERYMIYAGSLLLLALFLWIERGLPRPAPVVALALVLPGVAILTLPLSRLFEPAIIANAFSLVPLWRLAEGASHGIGLARTVLVGGTAGAVLLVSLVPRRIASVLAPLAVAAFFVAVSVPVTRAITGQAAAVRDLAGLPSNPSWIDRVIGPHQAAVYLNATAFEQETRLGRWWETWVPVWESEFWNRSLHAVQSLGAAEPSPLAQRSGRLDWLTGLVVPPPPERYVVADPRFEIHGRKLAATKHLELYKVVGPLRLTAASEGLYLDGTTGRLAAYDRWTTLGQRPARLQIEFSGTQLAGRATVTAGPLTAPPNGVASIATIRARAMARVLPRETTRLTLRPLRPPFRAELRLTASVTGAHIRIRVLESLK